jgi:23S rRNA (cytosine1962-C5)-methyltransferase
VDIDGIRFEVDPLGGQKTGLYLDQRENRRVLRRYAQGKKVLDLFCYNGAWSLSAIAGGASETVGVDGSEAAVAQARANALLNGAGGASSFVASDVFNFIKKTEKASFDIVICDPPAFARTKSAVAEARKGYTDVNRRAMAALKRGGLLVTCSCSYHMTAELFRESLLSAAQAAGRTLRLLESRGQAPDHPVLFAMPETQYLKCLLFEVS